jgi:cytoskeletal protein CcmA (bactofilin family)
MIISDFNVQSGNQEISKVTTDSILSGGGEKTFNGNLVISGNYSGRLFVKGTLTLEDNASVTGEIVANDLIMFGMFKGKARVKNLAVFHNSSSFSGTITAEEAEMHKGCLVSGTKNFAKISEKLLVTEKRNSYNSLADAISFKSQNDFIFMPMY